MLTQRPSPDRFQTVIRFRQSTEVLSKPVATI